MKRKDKLKFVSEYNDKYPTVLMTGIGYLQRSDTSYRITKTHADIDNTDIDLSKCIGLHKSLRCISLTALHVIRLEKEVTNNLEDITNKVNLMNKELNLHSDYTTYTIDTSIQSVFNKLTDWNIYAMDTRLAQLKVYNPSLFDSLVNSLNKLELITRPNRRINILMNERIFKKALQLFTSHKGLVR